MNDAPVLGAPGPPAAAAPALDEVAWSHLTPRCVALGHDFAVRTTDASLGRHLDRLFAPLAAPGVARQLYSHVDATRSRDARHLLWFGQEVVVATPDPRAVMGHLVWHVNRSAVDSSDDVVLHAAAGVWHGGAVLLPAAMEGGKTTLMAGLVQRGVGYLTDEAAAIDGAGRVLPFPKALSVDPGSQSVLADLAPAADPAVAAYAGPQWHVDARVIRPDALAGPAPVRWVVASSYRPGAPTRLTRLRPAEAVVALAENSFNLDRHPQGGLDRLAGVVEGAECYRLVRGDLHHACDAVLDLLSARPPDLRR